MILLCSEDRKQNCLYLLWCRKWWNMRHHRSIHGLQTFRVEPNFPSIWWDEAVEGAWILIKPKRRTLELLQMAAAVAAAAEAYFFHSSSSSSIGESNKGPLLESSEKLFLINLMGVLCSTKCVALWASVSSHHGLLETEVWAATVERLIIIVGVVVVDAGWCMMRCAWVLSGWWYPSTDDAMPPQVTTRTESWWRWHPAEWVHVRGR